MAEADTSNKVDIVVVGSVFMDLIGYGSKLPKPGQTIAGHDFKTGFGGKGANQCIAACRLGCKVAFVGKVGNDFYGQQYYDNMKSEGVVVDGLQMENDLPTGVALVMVSNDDGENLIMTVAGANERMTRKYVEDAAEKYIKNSKILVVQLETCLDSVLTSLRLAKQHGVTSIFNVAPALPDLPKEAFTLPDILCLNESEAEMVTGIENINNYAQAQKAVEFLKNELNANTVIITLGPQGALVWDKSTQKYQEFSAPKIAAVDTTGAGDAFIGTLAYCISKGSDLCTSVQQAILNASDSVLRLGTQSSFPYTLIQH